MQVVLDKITFFQDSVKAPSSQDTVADDGVAPPSTSVCGETVQDFQSDPITGAPPLANTGEITSAFPGQLAIRLMNQVAQHASYFGTVAEEMEQLKALRNIWDEGSLSGKAVEKSSDPNLIGLPTPVETPISITVHRAGRTRCKQDCKCACHRTTKIESPKFLKDLIGRILLGYAGSIVNPTPECTEATCQSAKQFHGYISYMFPKWFLAKVLTVTAWRYRTSDLHFVLGVRHYATNDDLFQQIFSGDLPELQKLLFEQKVNPNYVERGRGETALHVSIIPAALFVVFLVCLAVGWGLLTRSASRNS